MWYRISQPQASTMRVIRARMLILLCLFYAALLFFLYQYIWHSRRNDAGLKMVVSSSIFGCVYVDVECMCLSVYFLSDSYSNDFCTSLMVTGLLL